MNTHISKLFVPVLLLCSILGAAPRAQAQVQLTVDPSQNWIGYMNVSTLGNAYEYGQAWGTADLRANFVGTNLIIAPCTNIWETNDTFWVQGDGVTPNQLMDANFYVQNDALANTNLVFSGKCTANNLTTQPEPLTGISYTSVAFIKLFNSGYGLVGSVTSNLVAGQTFTISLSSAGATHVQYGFETIGPDANPATAASLGTVTVALPANAPPPPAAPTNAAPTPTNSASAVLAMYDSSGVYPTVPVDDWLAGWSGAAEASYTITNTSRVVLKYSNLQYAGVEFYTPDNLNVSAYNTMHIDVWTPTANQFGLQLVSINPTEAAQINFLPAGGKIMTNKWVSLDIPLNQFTGVNPSTDLTDLQQLLWIDNQTGGGVTGGIFYIDNVYFYSNSVAPPPIPTPTNNAPTPTAPSSGVLAMYDSSGTYPTVPVNDWLASWSGSSGGTFTITNTGAVVLEYGGLEYAGAEFYTPDNIDVTPYNTMHVDVWTPNANQFGIQLVSINPTEAAQVNILPASATIVSNRWVGLDIPLSSFASANTNTVLSDLQQLLWIDNQTGGGVTGGIFYIDNIYFYSRVVPLAPTLTAQAAAGSVQLSFPTQGSFNYTVQYKNLLTDPSWLTLTNVTGTGSTAIVPDSFSNTNRFYRLYVH
jgi:hypothetical protein